MIASKRKKTVEEYVGVSWNKDQQTYIAGIAYQGKKYPCGSADTPRGAALLRDRKIIALRMPYKLLQILKPKKEIV